MDKGVYHHVLPSDEDDRVQAVHDEEHRSCHTEEPSPPASKEQPIADRQLQRDRNHRLPEQNVEPLEREPCNEQDEGPTEQQDRRRVDIPRDAWCHPRWRDGVGLEPTHVRDSMNVCGHPYNSAIASKVVIVAHSARTIVWTPDPYRGGRRRPSISFEFLRMSLSRSSIMRTVPSE